MDALFAYIESHGLIAVVAFAVVIASALAIAFLLIVRKPIERYEQERLSDANDRFIEKRIRKSTGKEWGLAALPMAMPGQPAMDPGLLVLIFSLIGLGILLALLVNEISKPKGKLTAQPQAVEELPHTNPFCKIPIPEQPTYDLNDERAIYAATLAGHISNSQYWTMMIALDRLQYPSCSLQILAFMDTNEYRVLRAVMAIQSMKLSNEKMNGLRAIVYHARNDLV